MKLPVKAVLSVAVASVIWSQSAGATENAFYLSGKLGPSFIGLSGDKLEYYNDQLKQLEKYSGGSSTKAVFNGGVAIGYDFYQEYYLPLRTEFEVVLRSNMTSRYNIRTANVGLPTVRGYQSSEDAKNEVALNTFMINSYYDFKNASDFTPYVSLGLGMANVHQKTTNEYHQLNYSRRSAKHSSDSQSKTGNNFAWSLGVGGQYAINERLALDISYRYLNAGSLNINSNDEDAVSHFKISSSDMMLGVVYRF